MVWVGLLAAHSHAQVWEKYLAPGLTYRMEVDPDLPRTIHALRFNIHSDAVHAVPELGQGKVYNDDKTKGRATVSAMVKNFSAIAGVNASYFPYTGRPVGLMVRDGELISSPYKNRPEVGWGLNEPAKISLSGFSASFKAGGGDPVAIDTINEETKPDSISFDTDTCGWALAKSTPGTCAVLKMGEEKLTANGQLEGEVVEVNPNITKMAIPKGDAVLMGAGTVAGTVGALKPGDRVNIAVHIDGFDWNKVTNVVCGGPVLLKNGVAVLDWSAEGFNQGILTQTAP